MKRKVMSIEMKDSGIDWIGEIPMYWEVSAIKRNLQLYSGATPKTDNGLYWNGGVAWITPADYKTEDRWIECGSRYISEEGFKSCAVTMLPKGSIIFSKRAPIGLVIMNSAPLCTNQGCIGCVPFNGNGDYYYYAMSICSDQFELLGSGTTFKEISATSFSNFILPTPPIEEQSRIANFLDKKCAEIDELIALQDQMIAQLTTYKQTVITETVTKGLDPNVKMKDSGVEWIGVIPEHWNIAKLKNICSFHNGDRSQNYPSPEDFVENGVPFYGADSLNNLKADLKAARYITEEKYNSMGGLKIKEGDILYTLRGSTIGKNAIVTQSHGTTASSLMGIRIKNKKSISAFLLFWLHSICEYSQRDVCINGSTAPNLSAEDVKEFIIFLPSLAEQQSIAKYLDQKCKEIDELILVKKEKIEQLKAYKKSVIFEYVTGKKCV